MLEKGFGRACHSIYYDLSGVFKVKMADRGENWVISRRVPNSHTQFFTYELEFESPVQAADYVNEHLREEKLG